MGPGELRLTVSVVVASALAGARTGTSAWSVWEPVPWRRSDIPTSTAPRSETSSPGNPHRFDLALKPGESFFCLDRISSAEPGWGFKERIDFRYYPMAVPGEYAISAVGRFVHSGGADRHAVAPGWVD
jgi:hypothetical protein